MRPIARLMKPPEVADLFHVKPGTVVKWARIGKIRAVKTPGGRGYLFHPDDVAALMETDLAAASPENGDGPAPVQQHRDEPLMVPALTSPGRNTHG